MPLLEVICSMDFVSALLLLDFLFCGFLLLFVSVVLEYVEC